MVMYKPKPPKQKRKLGEFKTTKKTSKPRKLPTGPKTLTENKQTKTINGKGKGKDTKGKTPNWRDSTYLKQESYLKKLLADFNAKQIRSKADLAVYYGNEERAAQGEVREKDTVRKELVPEPKKKAPTKSSTTKTKGVKAGDDAVYKSKKPANKGQLTEHVVTNKPRLVDAGKKPKLVDAGKKPKLTEHKVTKTTKKPLYRNVVVKGKVVRQAIAGSHATEGLYQKELAEARLKDKADITDDYAARGVLHSGLYAQKQGDYEKEYGKQVAETNRQKASKYADLAEENRDFLTNQELEKEQARLEAIRRKAAKVGKVA